MISTRQWILKRYPTGVPTAAGDDATFKQVETALPPLQDGQVLLKTLYFSNEPAARGWIIPWKDDSRLSVRSTSKGSVMPSFALAEVVQSESEHVKKGDLVHALLGWSQYNVHDGESLRALPLLPGGLPVTHYMSVLGVVGGLTAYHGLVDAAQASEDDVLVVSSAAGSIGSMVVQIAKNMVKCNKVIGIAGGSQKCAWVKALGAEECIDYKAADFEERLSEVMQHQPATIYYDNVGGDLLDRMLPHMAVNGRIVVCGAVSKYNHNPGSAEAATTLHNWFQLITSKLVIKGYSVFAYSEKFSETRAKLTKALLDGEIDGSKVEQIEEADIERVPELWLRLFGGGSTGKLLTKLTWG